MMVPKNQTKANLKTVHHEAISLMVIGASNKMIAEKLSVSPVTVSSWLKKPNFRRELEQQMEHGRKLFQGRMFAAANKGIGVLNKLLEKTNENGDPDWEMRGKAAQIAI